MHGRLEYCSTTRLIGWAIGNGQPAELDVIVNGERIARIRCSRPRPDVSQERNPADIGFVFAFPKPVTASDVITVCFPDGIPLDNSAVHPMLHESSIDLCTASRIVGWAVYDDQPADLDVFVSDEPIGRVRCDRPRPDLVHLGAPLDCGFIFVFPHPIGPSDEVSVRFADGTALHGSPRNPTRSEGWLDVCTTTRVVGWAVYDGVPAELTISVSKERIARIQCDRPRADLVRAGRPENSGFEYFFPRPVIPSDEVSICFADGTNLVGSPRMAVPSEELIEVRALPDLPGPTTSEYAADFALSVLASEFVDDALFSEGLGGRKQSLDAVQRYLSLPRATRPNVSWFFDKTYYGELYPDVVRGGLDPLIHFIFCGVTELRNPHPLINLGYIRSLSGQPLPQTPTIHELLHFLSNDLADPSKYFSLTYYRAQLEEEVVPPTGLLRHFLEHGMLKGLKPVPGFGPMPYYHEVGHRNFDILSTLRAFVLHAEQFAAEIAAAGEPEVPEIVRSEPQIAAREIHLYCLAWNEAKILPHFQRHYRNFVDRFFVFDNGSTDATLSALTADERVSVTHFDVTGDSFVDEERRMSDAIWRNSRGRAAWVIMVDMDEFLYHPDLLAYLDNCARQRITAIEASGYEMIADHRPPPELPLTQTIVCGVREPFYDKLCIFNPNAIVSTNYRVGRHTAAPTGRVVWPPQKDVKLLHYKRLGVDHVVERYAQLKPGLRSRDLSNRWGVQYLMTRAEVEREFRRFRRDAAPVPGLSGFSEPDLRLVVDGRVLLPAEAAYNRYTFYPPPGTAFRLVTNTDNSTPPQAQRRVPVSRIFLRTATGVHTIALDDGRLVHGWSAVEKIGPHLVRWTNGNAVLPIATELGPVAAIEITLRWLA